MLARATLTTRGRVTIPQEVRDALEVRPGDEIRFTLENGTAILTRTHPPDPEGA
jgi:AbrB family looped-hinge helix DNA binding protein